MKFQDWTVGASGGVSHKESINTTEIKEPILKGNHVYAEHYEISSGDTKGDRKHKPGVLPLEVIDTEVGDCNTHFADREEFLNKSEDTRYSLCLGLEDNTHIGSKLDTCIHSSTDKGDDNLSKILTVGSTNNPEVKNVEADSDLNA